MRRIKQLVLWVLALCTSVPLLDSCANARYAMGPETSDIEALPGYEGTIKAITYKSSEPRVSFRRFVAYLPKGYGNVPGKRYPVMYLLHGARGNEVTWIERGDALITLDSLRAEGAAEDFILILANVNNYFSDKEYRNGHAINAVRAFWLVDGETETHFMEDLVHTVDSVLLTIPEKESRAIAGMSTGGMQAAFLSANHPGSFGYVGLFSGYKYNTVFGLRHPEFYCGINRKMKAQFADPPKYYGLMIGDTDIFYPHNRMFDRDMTRKNYAHEMLVTPGGHEWYNWRKFLIHFYGKVFK